MLDIIKTFIWRKPDKDYLDFFFSENKKSLVTGLTFTLITVSALSVVDILYYSDLFDYPTHEAALKAGGKVFEFDNFFRLFLAPILNLSAIFLARSSWNNSMIRLEKIAAGVIIINVLSFLGTGFYNDYYTAAKDFSYDVLVLILFSQTLFGLTFRTSFIYNSILVLITITYLLLDDDPLNEFIYSLVLVLLIWIPVLLGTFKLAKSRLSNFNTISKLRDANKEIAKQKKLLKAGEEVSQILSWNASKGLKNISYTHGIHAIYDFQEDLLTSQNVTEKIYELIHPEDKKAVLQQATNLLREQFEPVSEHRIILPNGEMKWLKCTIGDYVEGEGYYGTIQDVTKDKLLELTLQHNADELEMRNQELEQFAYASSHDLQEPLRSISNFVMILNKKMKDQLTAEHQLYMNLVLQSTGRMKNLINAILDYSRIGKNKKLEKIDVNEVIQGILTDLHYAIEQSSGVVEVGDLPTIVGYKTEFSMLMQNLISNALKFRKKSETPHIYIKNLSTQHEYHFCVRDNGIGMEQKYAERIFQLFSRLHSKEEYEGTGIGLTHSKKIVELHGGKIWANSILGTGTTFHFTISKKLKVNSNEKEIELHPTY